VTPENAAQYLFPEFHRSNNEQKSQIPGGRDISNALALLACLFFLLLVFEFAPGSICVCSQIR
jgi:hypothetical protein